MLAKFIDRPREDSLTAAVFSHLLHLPSDEFWGVLRRACHSTALPEHAGEPMLIESWPQWSAAGIPDRDRVVPDLFLRFPDFDLIVEAKIRDEGTQYEQQWQYELAAYANTYGREKREVMMIALGGIHTHHDARLIHQWDGSATPGERETHLFNCPVFMCQWSTVLLECQRLVRRLMAIPTPTVRDFADRRILADLIALARRHGYGVLRWLEDLELLSLFMDDRASDDLAIFQAASRRFQTAML